MHPGEESELDLINRTVHQKHLSPLMRARAKSGAKTVNACPFGCGTKDLDEHGYCYHLVGFTVPGNDKVMEVFEPGDHEFASLAVRGGKRFVNGQKTVPVPPKARLVLITVCSRVYDPDARDWRAKEPVGVDEEKPTPKKRAG
jgi:hypothetical protein